MLEDAIFCPKSDMLPEVLTNALLTFLGTGCQRSSRPHSSDSWDVAVATIAVQLVDAGGKSSSVGVRWGYPRMSYAESPISYLYVGLTSWR
jgi:hypothetical protein